MNNQQPHPAFIVIAGQYETGYSDDENIQFTSEPVTIDEALALACQHRHRPFCFICYGDNRLDPVFLADLV